MTPASPDAVFRSPAEPSESTTAQRVHRWFVARGWEPFPFQKDVWCSYLAGESGLIHAPTGTGKTLATWLGPLLEWLAEHPSGRASAPPLRVLWITPLRALASDTETALRVPLDDLGIPWTLERRTSDTGTAARARQRRRLPSVLITTPESVSLLLSRLDAAEQFRGLRCVVVDEWHELLGTKRGVQTELALARLRVWNPQLRTWGMSATIGNLDEACAALLGADGTGHVIQGAVPKQVRIDALIPELVERFPWAGHLGIRMIPQVVAAIEQAETALLFTNTRAQTEQWYQALLEARPDWAGVIALHHGSLDRKTRDWVEEELRAGGLRCVVATSTLDLGVDFAPVDRVLQVGSPKGIARLLQRAGRSGHSPGRPSRVTCVPTHAFELLETAAARDAAEEARIESRLPVRRPLDVLAQHLVTVALGGGFRAEELLAEVRSTHAYHDLSETEWSWTLNFVTHGGEALGAYPEYRKVVVDEGRYTVEDAGVAKRHRMAIGTIVGDALVRVQYQRGPRVGSVEESFVARLRPGDRFVLGGKALEFVRVRDMVAWVRKAPNTRGAIPRWQGSRMPWTTELAAAVRDRLDEAARGEFRGPEMEAVRLILELQARWSRIPTRDELLVERVRTREGWHLFVFPFAGRLVHEGLAALAAYRLSRREPATFTLTANDYGFELLSAAPVAWDVDVLHPEALAADIASALNETEMARRQFREIARVAGLVFPGYPHAGKTARQLQASSGLFFDVFRRYDPENPLLQQAFREVLERQLEGSRLEMTMQRIRSGGLTVTEPSRPTPLAFPLLVDRARETISSEFLADRVKRMQILLERAAGAA